MVAKPRFLLLLLIGSLALATCLATLTGAPRNREGPVSGGSMPHPEPAARTDATGTAGDSGLQAETGDAAAGRAGEPSTARARLDASLSKRAAAMMELLEQHSRFSAESPPSLAAPSSAGIGAPAGRLNPAEPIKSSSPSTAATTVAAGASAGAPGSVEDGLPQRKIPLFARDRPGDHVGLPPPPVIDPITDPNADPQRNPVLPDPGDDGTNEESGADRRANSPPSADAGDDRTVFVGDVVTLDGSGSMDPDGDPLTLLWEFTAKPVGSNAFISDTSAVTAAFTADAAGAYIVQLVVDDGLDESLPQLVVIKAELRGLAVPKVVGLSLAQARKALAGAGLTVGRISTVPNPGVAKNEVVDQMPAGDSPAAEGVAVSLVISFPPGDDDDQDGLPDAWEYTRFGHLDQAGRDDADGDGYSNYQEYRVDTDPADRAEAPVPAGNFFEYDAFGRIVVKQITMEP